MRPDGYLTSGLLLGCLLLGCLGHACTNDPAGLSYTSVTLSATNAQGESTPGECTTLPILLGSHAMNTIDFAPFTGAGNNELDSVQHRALTRHVRSEVISLKELSAVGVDLKDHDSMTQFDRVAKLMEECPHLEHLDPFIWESAKRAKP